MRFYRNCFNCWEDQKPSKLDWGWVLWPEANLFSYGHMVYCIWLESLLITTSDCEMSIDILSEDHLESTKCSETLPSSIKIRSWSAHPTWQHSQEPKGDEPKYEGRRNEQIYYCKYCTSISYSTWALTTFRNHLSKTHSIEIVIQTYPVKKAHISLLRDVFAKAGQSGVTKLDRQEEQIL
jgi:hypothetical protein